jgi:HEAT repeat protein
MGELGEVLAEQKVVEAVPFLINRLKSDNSEIRVDAAEALRGVTGLPIEVVPGDEESRRLAIRAYSRWWEDSKKERRRAGDGKS